VLDDISLAMECTEEKATLSCSSVPLDQGTPAPNLRTLIAPTRESGATPSHGRGAANTRSGEHMGTPPGKLTFVCCIEHGRLEGQTLLMLETLRKNGGSLGDAPVLAVVGRLGPPLARTTSDALRRLDVQVVRDLSANPAPWLNYGNKVAAVRIAQERAFTPLVAWLDSDVLVAAEPSGLLLPDGVDFAGRCEFLPPAVHPGKTLHVPYWQELCRLLGTDFSNLPLTRLHEISQEVRLYFNSGVFAWRRKSGFAVAYYRAFQQLIASRLAQCDGTFFTADQVIIAPVLVGHGIPWRHLPLVDHHMIFQQQIIGPRASPSMKNSRVIHYSRSLTPPYREQFLGRLEAEAPSVFDLVRKNLASSGEDRTRFSMPAWGLKVLRAVKYRTYAMRLRRAPRGASS
jgi:hypothetical protein